MAPPSGAIPPTLAPSVEEAYRRKCVQLKQRMIEVEESNDAARVRILREQRAIEKLRLERAFLLEQLAKRTSTNVEDSEGSPSPPPSPKEKPLRTKRGHRKPSFLANLGDTSTNFISHGGTNTLSPSSDAFSHTHPDGAVPPRTSTPQARTGQKRGHASNGFAAPVTSTPPPRQFRNGFDLYCNDLRSVLSVKNRVGLADGSYNIEQALAEGWQSLDANKKDEFQQRAEKTKQGQEIEATTGAGSGRQSTFDAERATPTPTPAEPVKAEDEDVEMGDDTAEGAGTDGGADSGAFTAVNRD